MSGIVRRLLVSVLVGTVVVVASGTAPVAAQGRPDPVVDEAGVLTPAETRVLTRAVRDVRERTDYLPTIVAVPALAGRTAQRIANRQAPPPAQTDRIPVVLVLSADPVRAEVVVQVGDLTPKQSRTIEDAKQDTLAALVNEGLAPSGLAFTGALIEGGTESSGVRTAKALLRVALVLVLLYLGLRALFRWRRTRGVPSEASAIGEVTGDNALIRGQIVSGEWVSIGNSPQLVWYERTDTSWTDRYRITSWSDGSTTSEHVGTDTHKEVSRGGCPFLVSDGTGQAWADGSWVDGYGKKMDSSGWWPSGNRSHWTDGVPLGAEVTLGGPCHRDADGTLVFQRRGGAGVLLALTKPGAARRIYRRPMWWYLIKAGGAVVLYLLIVTVLSNA